MNDLNAARPNSKQRGRRGSCGVIVADLIDKSWKQAGAVHGRSKNSTIRCDQTPDW